MTADTTEIRAAILQAVTARRMNVAQLALHLQAPVRAVQQHVKTMAKARPPQLRVVGTWAQLVAATGCAAGRTRGDASVYGPPGAEYLGRHQHRGERAGPRYVPPQQTLRRDLFEHMKLAMVARN